MGSRTQVASSDAGEATTLAIAANGVGAWLAIVFAFWNGHYFVPGALFAFGLGVALLVGLGVGLIVSSRQ